MSKTIYFCSLKFAPGLFKEMEQWSLKMRQHGWRTRLLSSAHYHCLNSCAFDEVQHLTTSNSSLTIARDSLGFPLGMQQRLAASFAEAPPDFLCIYNPHPLNGFVASLAQQAKPAGIRAVFLHEPYVPDKSSYEFLKSQYIRLVEFQQAHMMRHLNCVVVPSEHSLALYRGHYPPGKPVYVAPILLADKRLDRAPREYYSFVGTVNASRSLDEFVQLINYAALNGANLKFKIVTRSPIQPSLGRLDPRARHMLEVVNRSIITDGEIAETLAQSRATFLSHKQAAQSGNVPVAFMQGTPIICRDIPGLTQHVQHKINGYVLPYDFDTQQLYEAVLYMEDHWKILGCQARQDYKDIFDIANWERYYSWLL